MSLSQRQINKRNKIAEQVILLINANLRSQNRSNNVREDLRTKKGKASPLKIKNYLKENPNVRDKIFAQIDNPEMGNNPGAISNRILESGPASILPGLFVGPAVNEQPRRQLQGAVQSKERDPIQPSPSPAPQGTPPPVPDIEDLAGPAPRPAARRPGRPSARVPPPVRPRPIGGTVRRVRQPEQEMQDIEGVQPEPPTVATPAPRSVKVKVKKVKKPKPTARPQSPSPFEENINVPVNIGPGPGRVPGTVPGLQTSRQQTFGILRDISSGASNVLSNVARTVGLTPPPRLSPAEVARRTREAQQGQRPSDQLLAQMAAANERIRAEVAAQRPVGSHTDTKHSTRASQAGHSGDVQQNIRQEAQGDPINELRGLGLPQAQARRLARDFTSNPETRRNIEQVLSGSIDLNEVAANTLILAASSIIGVPGAARPLLRGLFDYARTNTDIDFNRYFNVMPGGGVRVNFNEIRTIEPALGADMQWQQQTRRLSRLRRGIVEQVDAGNLAPEVLNTFDRVSSNRLYVINTYEPDSPQEKRDRVNNYLEREADMIEGFQELLRPNNEMSREEIQNNFSTLFTIYDDVLRDAPLADYDDREVIESVRNHPATIPTVRLTNEIHDLIRNAPPGTYNEGLQRILQRYQNRILSSDLSPEQKHLLLVGLAEEINDAQEAFLAEGETAPQVPIPTPEEVNQEINNRQARQAGAIGTGAIGAGALGGALAGALGGANSPLVGSVAGALGGPPQLGSVASAPATGAMAGGIQGAVLGGAGALAGGAIGGVPGAVAGGIAGAALGAGAGYPLGIAQVPIIPPTQKVVQQDSNKGRGTLRPKFIIPSTEILQPSNSEIQADFDEWAAFDFVQPTSEGTDGNILTNSLKQQQAVTNAIRFDKAGVQVNSLYGEPLPYSEDKLRDLLIGPPLPEMTFGEQTYNLSEFEVKSYDVNNDRTQVEFFDPYKDFTNVTQNENTIEQSILFGQVP